MKIGFTGTEKGMTNAQKKTVRALLLGEKGEAHHGDCIGSDEEFHDIATELGFRTVKHPPSNPAKQAHCKADATKAPKPYIQRNHDIVDDIQKLIAAPKGYAEEIRSGTWATIRYARKINRPCRIVFPNGAVGT